MSAVWTSASAFFQGDMNFFRLGMGFRDTVRSNLNGTESRYIEPEYAWMWNHMHGGTDEGELS